MGISPKAAAAAAFTPRGSGTQKPGRKERRAAPQGSQLEGTVTPASISHSKAPSNEFIPQQGFQTSFQEFVPQNFVSPSQVRITSYSGQSTVNNFLNTYRWTRKPSSAVR
jgi:PAB-dependent poly(A)-specific ribonuclease subunit 3